MTFSRQEMAPLFKAFLILAMPLLILMGIILGIFQTENLSFTMGGGDITNPNNLEYFQNMIIQYGLIIIIYYLSASVISSITLGYIVEYINNGPKVPFENVLSQVKIFLSRILALNLVYYLIIMIASLFFLIPGIFLAISLILSPVVLVLEDTGIGESMKRSIYFTKGYWWRTLGYMLVIGIVYTIISMVFSIPGMILGIFFAIGPGEASPDSPLMLMLTIISSIISTFSYLFSALLIIFSAFYYHSQYELKEAGNLMKSIDEVTGENL
jgi:hypothetical protein